MAHLTVSHSGNMDISESYAYEDKLYVKYGTNETGKIVSWTTEEPAEYVRGRTYTVKGYPVFSGTVYSETFTVSGIDVDGNPRSDLSVLRQDYDKNLLHYSPRFASSWGVVINSTAVTQNSVECNFTVTGGTETGFMGFVFTFGVGNQSFVLNKPYTEPSYPGFIRVDYNIETTGETTIITNASNVEYVIDVYENTYYPSTGSTAMTHTFTETGVQTLFIKTSDMNIPSFRGNQIIKYAYLPDGFVFSVNYTFGNSTIQSVRLPGDLPRIRPSSFQYCSQLTGITIPNSVTNLQGFAFDGCSSLQTAVLSTSLTNVGTYVFRNCTGLTGTITIPSGVTILDNGFFYNCRNLTGVVLENGVNNIMYSAFYYCQSLTSITIPESVETIGDDAFSYCSGLTQMTFLGETPPTLNTPDPLGDTGYTFPFYVPCQSVLEYKEAVSALGYDPSRVKCSNIATSITLNVAESIRGYGLATTVVQPETAFTHLVYSCSDTSVAVINENTGRIIVLQDGTVNITVTDLISGLSDTKEVNMIAVPSYFEYLTFEIIGDGEIRWNGQEQFGEVSGQHIIQYSKNDGPWITIYSQRYPTAPIIPVVAGDIVKFKGNNMRYSYGDSPVYSTFGCTEWNIADGFPTTATFNLSGNIMSLIYGDDFIGKERLTLSQTFYGLFYGVPNLIDASRLCMPAMTLADACYYAMFSRCTSLTTAPELPATTLAKQCYYDMFEECHSLRTSPELPAMVVEEDSYGYMFTGSGLITAPELPATTLARYCYEGMFKRCGALTTAPSILPATTLEQYCYLDMFYYCANLTTAPELPARGQPAIYQFAYKNMFWGCLSLRYVKCLSEGGGNNWMVSVRPGGTFVKYPDPTYHWSIGVNGIPEGWTIIDAT